ncbi:MAG: hypothetical protein FJY88_03160 [Candidatus Eisenbacteria bacterium]|nr:hypothetical protein [Candidatus Eisenbacteria bacterium]
MASSEFPMERKILPATLAAGARKALKGRGEIRPAIKELAALIPHDAITGPPFCLLQYITDVEGAYDIDVCFPVSREIAVEGLFCRMEPELEVLAHLHRGPTEGIREAYRALHRTTAERGVISDEFGREVYPDWETADATAVEVQFVVHRWEDLFARHAERVLGSEAARDLLANRPAPGLEATGEERFAWVKAAVEKLDRDAGDDRTHEILTGCAHVFPDRQIDRLRSVHDEAMERTGDRGQAIDAVLAFRAANPPWRDSSTRQGNVVIATKRPRDPEAYEKAETSEEKRRAYCFCPIIRDRLGEGMPGSFCYCGAGWERRQWTGTIGEPVRVRVLHSVLRGDDACSFAIELPEA